MKLAQNFILTCHASTVYILKLPKATILLTLHPARQTSETEAFPSKDIIDQRLDGISVRGDGD